MKTQSLFKQINENLENLASKLSSVETEAVIKNYLKFCGQFHGYSFYNQFWLSVEAKHRNENVERFASFAKWKYLGAKVQKGSKAFHILHPVEYTEYQRDEKGDIRKDHNGNKIAVINPDTGKPVKKRTFWVGPVFDVNQTNAKEIGIYKELEYRDKSAKIDKALLEQIENKIKTVYKVGIIEDNSMKARGAYDYGKDEIYMRNTPEVTSGMYLSTLFHELGHKVMHGDDLRNQSVKYEQIHDSRGAREGEAEAFSYAMSSMFGIENKSELYLKNWGNNEKELRSRLESISSSVKAVSSKLEIENFLVREPLHNMPIDLKPSGTKIQDVQHVQDLDLRGANLYSLGSLKKVSGDIYIDSDCKIPKHSWSKIDIQGKVFVNDRDQTDIYKNASPEPANLEQAAFLGMER